SSRSGGGVSVPVPRPDGGVDHVSPAAPHPAVDPADPGLLPSARSPPRTDPLLRLLRPHCGTHSGEAFPGAILPGDRRVAVVVSVAVRRLTVRPRHPGGNVLPTAPRSLTVAGGVGGTCG